MKKSIFLIIIITFFYSCEEPCPIGNTGPPSFTVEIVDATTNENVFTNGTFSENQLQVTTEGSLTQSYGFISDENLNRIIITPAWSEGVFLTKIKLNNEIVIPIRTLITKSSTKCFENHFITNLVVENYAYTFDNQNGVYKIKI
jgi:hypothetical protein